MCLRSEVWASEGVLDNRVVSLDEARTELKVYLMMNEWDFVGRNGEKLYFRLEDEYAQGSRIKELIFDIGTLDLQVRMFCKAFDDNIYLYEGLGILAGYNYLINASKISKVKKIKYKWKLIRSLFGKSIIK